MSRVGVRCIAAEACHDVPTTNASGWRFYKRVFAAERAHRAVANARDLHPLQPIVIEMYRSLHLAPAMEDMVGAVMNGPSSSRPVIHCHRGRIRACAGYSRR